MSFIVSFIFINFGSKRAHNEMFQIGFFVHPFVLFLFHANSMLKKRMEVQECVCVCVRSLCGKIVQKSFQFKNACASFTLSLALLELHWLGDISMLRCGVTM